MRVAASRSTARRVFENETTPPRARERWSLGFIHSRVMTRHVPRVHTHAASHDSPLGYVPGYTRISETRREPFDSRLSASRLDPDTRGASARTTVEGSLSRVIDEWVTPDFVFVLFRIDVQRARVT